MYRKTMLIGNLGGDPELRYVPSGQAVSNASLAVSEKWTTQDGEKKENTTWYKLTVWGKSGETFNKICAKGSKVFIEGTVDLEEWEHDGEKHARLSCRVQSWKILSGGKPRDEQSQPEVEEDDIPF